MKDKILKISTISATIILILAIIITSLVFVPGKGDSFADPNVDNVVDTGKNYVTSDSSDGVVSKTVSYSAEFHEKIDDEASLLKYLEEDTTTTKYIGLLTKDITIKNSSMRNKILSTDKTLDGNGFTITINNDDINSGNSADPSVVEVLEGDLAYRYSYYGGVVGANYGTITNLKVEYNGTNNINQDINSASVANEAYADGFAAGVVAGINFGVINNVSATVNAGSALSFSATHVDVFSGVLAGVNYGIITRATSVLNSTMTSTATEKMNVLSAGVGLMISNKEFTAHMGEITVKGSVGAIIKATGSSTNTHIGVVFGVNSNHCLKVEHKLSTIYKIGEINGVISDYYGTVLKNNATVNNLTAGSCGYAGNIYYTNNNINVNNSVVTCTGGDGDPLKVYPNNVNVIPVDVAIENTPEVKLSFSSSSNSIGSQIKINVNAGVKDNDNKQLIVYNVEQEARTLTNNVISTTKVNTNRIKYNDADKVLAKHANISFTEIGATHTASLYKDFKTITVNYGTLGLVSVDTEIDKSYTGKVKATVKFKDSFGKSYTTAQSASIGIYGRIEGTDNYNLLNTPGKYDFIKTEMISTYNSDGTLKSDNSGVTYVDIEKKIIFPISSFNYTGVITDGSEVKSPYSIEYAAANIDIVDRNNSPVNIDITNPQNYYKVKFSIENIDNPDAITSVRYTTPSGDSGEGKYDNTTKTIEFDNGDFGRDGKFYTFVGYNGEKAVTYPVSTMLYLDAVAPELNINFDNMTDWDPNSQIVIRGTAFDANDGSLEVKFEDSLKGSSPVNVTVNADMKFKFSVVESGKRDVTISVTDSAGNTTTETIKLMIDNVKPTFTCGVTSEGSNYVSPNVANKNVEFKININSLHLSGINVFVQLDNGRIMKLTKGTEAGQVYKYTLKATPKEGTLVKIFTVNGANAESIIYAKTVIINSEEKELTVEDFNIPNSITKSYDGTNKFNGRIELKIASSNVNITAVYSDINVGKNIPLIISIENNVDDGVKYFFNGEIFGNITKAEIDIVVGDMIITYSDEVTNLSTVVRDVGTSNVITDKVFNDINVILNDRNLDISNLIAGTYILTVDEEKCIFDNYVISKVTTGELKIEKLEVVVKSDNDGFYNQSYTGTNIDYNPYFINKDGIRVDLTVKYSNFNSGTPVSSPINAGEYKAELKLNDTDVKNYTLQDTNPSTGTVDKSLIIHKFKPEFEVNKISLDNVLNVTYKAGADTKYLEYNDGSDRLVGEAKEHYNKHFTITYTELNGNPTDIAPTYSGTYSVVMEFTGDSDTNFANQRKVFTMVVDELDKEIIFKNMSIPFSENQVSPVIASIPEEFGSIGILGEDTASIKFLTLAEYQSYLISGYKLVPNILYIILTRVNISDDELEAGQDSDDLANTFSYILAGSYDFELMLHNHNYNFSSIQYDATLNIERVNVGKLVNFADKEVDYDMTNHTIDEPTWNEKYTQVEKVPNEHENTVNAGTYTFVFIATSDNLISGTQKFSITLTINKINFNKEDIKTSANYYKQFDGKPFDIKADKLPLGADFVSHADNVKLINVGTHRIVYTVVKKNYNDSVVVLSCGITPVKVDVVFDDHDKIRIDDTIALTGHFIDISGAKIPVTIDISKVNGTAPGLYTCDVSIADTNYVINKGFETYQFELYDEIKVGLIVGLVIGTIIGSVLTYLVTMMLIKKKRQTIYL